MSKVILIDGHSILNRAYYGIPLLSNAEGLHTNAVYGFLNIMFKILDEEKADYLAVAFDVHAPTFRHEMFEAYKGTRKPMPEELREQVPVIKEVLHAMQIPTLEHAGYEADDILGTLGTGICFSWQRTRSRSAFRRRRCQVQRSKIIMQQMFLKNIRSHRQNLLT